MSQLVVTGPVLSERTFTAFRELIHSATGIRMRESKQILVSNRLRRRLTKLGLETYEQYYELLTAGSAGEEMQHFIDAVSTNETYFYREDNHFRALAGHVLPELSRRRQPLTIWSAGCSTGEEVYTLRFVADEAARTLGIPGVRIIGTDISASVIARAREGIYGERALRLVPPALLRTAFEPRDDGAFQVRRELRERVEFQVHNLFRDPPPARGVHVLFCRNVMIYFDKPTQSRLVDGIFAPALDPDGFLFIGHSESLSGFTRSFAYLSELKAPIYRLKKEGST